MIHQFDIFKNIIKIKKSKCQCVLYYINRAFIILGQIECHLAFYQFRMLNGFYLENMELCKRDVGVYVGSSYHLLRVFKI